MSLKSFFQKLFGGLKHVFNGLDQPLKDALRIGVEVVDKLKTLVDSPGADLLTAIIPGTIDDVIKERLRVFLPKILIELKLVENCASQTDPNVIIQCAVDTLQRLTGDWVKDGSKKNFLDSLAVLVAQCAADGKFDWDDVKYLTKWYYDHIYKG
jgi:hypothetical protein